MNNMLEKDEQIIWEGAPNKKSYFTQKFAIIIPILLVFGIVIGMFMMVSGVMGNPMDQIKNTFNKTTNIIQDTMKQNSVTTTIGSNNPNSVLPLDIINNTNNNTSTDKTIEQLDQEYKDKFAKIDEEYNAELVKLETEYNSNISKSTSDMEKNFYTKKYDSNKEFAKTSYENNKKITQDLYNTEKSIIESKIDSANTTQQMKDKFNTQVQNMQNQANSQLDNVKNMIPNNFLDNFSSAFNGIKLFQTFIMIIVGVILLSVLIAPILEYKNIRYAITNKRILIQKGIIGKSYRTVEYTKIDDIDVRIGLFNKMFNTGTIVFTGDFGHVHTNNGVVNSNLTFEAIDNPYDVFNKVKEVSRDIRTDVYYPNELRPDENNGYNTEYKK
jgi:hypothetical protein